MSMIIMEVEYNKMRSSGKEGGCHVNDKTAA